MRRRLLLVLPFFGFLVSAAFAQSSTQPGAFGQPSAVAPNLHVPFSPTPTGFGFTVPLLGIQQIHFVGIKLLGANDTAVSVQIYLGTAVAGGSAFVPLTNAIPIAGCTVTVPAHGLEISGSCPISAADNAALAGLGLFPLCPGSTIFLGLGPEALNLDFIGNDVSINVNAGPAPPLSFVAAVTSTTVQQQAYTPPCSDALSTPVTASTTLGGNWLHASLTGNTVTVAADPSGLAPAVYTGAAQVYSSNGFLQIPVLFKILPPVLEYIQQGPKFAAFSTASTAQGFSVSVTPDGSTAIVGAVGAGAFSIFQRIAGLWGLSYTESYQNLAQATASGQIGYSTAVSADGGTLLIGGPADSSGTGAAWVIGGPCGGQKLTVRENAKSVGSSVALSADGLTALVGGPNFGTGAGWIFECSQGLWREQGMLSGTAAQSSAQGSAVALSADGNTALIGGSDSNAPAMWVFTRGQVWGQQAELQDLTAGHGHTAAGVAISADGLTSVFGEPAASHIDAFTLGGNTWTATGPVPASGGASQPITSVSLSADGQTVAAVNPTGAVVAARSGSTWTAIPILPPLDLVGPWTLDSIQLSGDATTLIVGDPNDNNSVGAVWAYTLASPPPIVNTLDPTTANAGTSFVLVVDGQNFRPGTTVRVNNVAAQTLYGNTVQMAVAVPGSAIPSAGTVPVVVVNPDGGTSVSQNIQILAPAFQISSFHSGSFATGRDGLYTITVSNPSVLPAASGATVAEQAPAGLSVVALWGDGWTCGTSDCQRTDPLPSLANYPPVYAMMAVSRTASGSVMNHATVSGSGFLSATTGNLTQLTVANPCDTNLDSLLSIADVQEMIDEALGLQPAFDDVNGYGVVNVADVQTVMNGVLKIPGPCVAN